MAGSNPTTPAARLQIGRRAQPTVLPPVTEIRWPVTNWAELEARKATASPTSAGAPIRFMGTPAA
jgi:hypothetical protein